MRLRQVRLRSSLSFPHDVVVPRLLTVTFTTTAFFSAAAYGCLRPPPDGRSRKACFHLSHSMRLAPLLDTMKPQTWNTKRLNFIGTAECVKSYPLCIIEAARIGSSWLESAA